MVPVLRDADQLGFAGIEKDIGALGEKARDGKMRWTTCPGGTFTITNGGVYRLAAVHARSSTRRRAAILGMHTIQKRPVVVDGQVVIRPMMYLALTYDHRIIDGKEAVTFLVRVKEGIEDPQRLLLDL